MCVAADLKSRNKSAQTLATMEHLLRAKDYHITLLQEKLGEEKKFNG